jgi:ABC-type multidrug transport system ATPase subunit
MISLENISLRLGAEEDAPPLLSGISGKFGRGEFVAILGPSGCGKSTLLKMIAGVSVGESEGVIRWDGRDLAEEDFRPGEFGYVPQFSIAHEELTVEECVGYSSRLRVAGLSDADREEMVTRLLVEVGLEEFRDRLTKVLSGGQRRRLALAMELVSSPPILLCDEVTSGLDPESEDEVVNLLRDVAHDGNRLVLSVTHSLKHLLFYDAVVVLYKGVLAYAGSPELLAHYFQVEDPGQVYSRLSSNDPETWKTSWIELSAAYERDGEIVSLSPLPEQTTTCPGCGATVPEAAESCGECGLIFSAGDEPATVAENEETSSLPGLAGQVAILVGRRFKIFFRSRAQLWLQAGLVLGFPCLVALFGWDGLPQIRNLSMGLGLDVVQQLTEARDFLVQGSLVGSLISGIVMFEVILLTLMGANNSGREIAAERQIFEKEKLSGLSPLSYVASKVLFLGTLSAIQSLWMGLFIHFTCSFPGDLPAQLLFLFLVNAAMTSVCLAISSFMPTAEQASMASIYLVGFQLPLSGAVIALPAWFGPLVRPFIAAYWSWSGMLQTLSEERYYDIVQMVIQTRLSPAALCVLVLAMHVVLGLFAALQGCKRTRME